MPKVSIGLPVYNGAKFIGNALDILLTQSFDDFELIISDNCSTDETQAICTKYASTDARIRYIKQSENIGISRNMEFLLHQAKGEFFMWAADDDRWDKDFIRILLTALEENSNLVMAFCPYSFIDEDSRPILEMKTRSIDYSGKSTLSRLIKLCYFYDDGCGYSLFRRKLMENVHLPVWWGVNRLTAYNNMYPPLFFFLSAGNFKLFSSKVMWLNRLRNQPRHIVPFPEKQFLRYLAFVLRKFNVGYLSVFNVYKGSKSIPLAIAISPFVFLRFIYDSFVPLTKKLFSVTLKIGKKEVA
jgi:glycosyltransferase involved in cell wall biosynthesis